MVVVMQNREYGLVPNQVDQPRFMRAKSYEAISDGVYVGTSTPVLVQVVPVVREWALLDVSNPNSYGYKGADWRWVVVSITEERHFHRPSWPNGVTSETEMVRRLRIRQIRQLIHVDPRKGAREPRWQEQPHALAFQSGRNSAIAPT